MRPEQRWEFVTKEALAIGERWVATTCEELRKDGRPVEGGWPGTLSEARALAGGTLAAVLARRRLSTLTTEELANAASAVYEHARRRWLALPERA